MNQVTVYVRLLDEVVDVWRPVEALELSNGNVQILDSESARNEEWEFEPGDVVVTELREFEGQERRRVAVALA